MVRRQINKLDTNLCQAAGTIKGKSITVSLVPPLTESMLNVRKYFVGMGAASWDTVPNDIEQPTIVLASMCPGTFHADGYGFDVTFDVGVVRRKVGKRITSMFDITFIALGERAGGQVKNMVKPPDLSMISRPGLLRLALKAAAIVGVAYPPGWTTDLRGKYITRLKDGDSRPPGNCVVFGTTDVRTRSQSTGEILVSLVSSPEVIVQSKAGGDIDEQYMRNLIGQVRVGRHKERGSMTDPQVLKLVANLYVAYETAKEAQGMGQPEYARQQLEKRGIYKSESWVRSVAVAARKNGDLKQGKRNKSTAKDKR